MIRPINYETLYFTDSFGNTVNHIEYNEIIKYFHDFQEKYMDSKTAKELKEYLYLQLFCEQLQEKYAR
jgi:hypothetical protein